MWSFVQEVSTCAESNIQVLSQHFHILWRQNTVHVVDSSYRIYNMSGMKVLKTLKVI